METIPVEFYEQYKKLIYSQAWKWCWESGINYDEMVSEGNLVFCQCYHRWDKRKAKFSTWLTVNLNFRFQDITNNRKCLSPIPPNLEDKKDTNYQSLMNNIPSDCKRLVRIVLLNYYHRKEMGIDAPQSLSVLKDYLKSIGWKSRVIRRRIKRTKSFFRGGEIK